MKINGVELTKPQYSLLKTLLNELESGEEIRSTIRFERESSDVRKAVSEERVLVYLHRKGLVDFDNGEFWLTSKGVEIVKAIAQETVA